MEFPLTRLPHLLPATTQHCQPMQDSNPHLL